MKLLALLALPAYFLQTVIHEGAHALAVVLQGGKVLWFKPWPQRLNGRWRFGGTGWSERTQEAPAMGHYFLVYAAPRLLNLIQLVALWFAPMHPVVLLARLAAAVDFSVNTVGIASQNQTNDARKCLNALPQPWRRAWGWGMFIALPMVWMLAFLPGVP